MKHGMKEQHMSPEMVRSHYRMLGLNLIVSLI